MARRRAFPKGMSLGSGRDFKERQLRAYRESVGEPRTIAEVVRARGGSIQEEREAMTQ